MQGVKIYCTVTNDLVGDRRMIRTCEFLTSQGADVTLVGRVLRGSEPVEKHNFDQHRIQCFFNRGKLFYLEYNLRLMLFLWSKDFHILCTVDLDTAIAGRLIKRFKPIKWIVDSHEWFPFVPEVERRKVVQKIWLSVEKMVMVHADVVYTVGNQIAKSMQDKYAKEIYVVRNMPEEREVSNHVPKPAELENISKEFILYQGALNEARGLERLIRVMEYIPYDLVLIGDGDIKEKLEMQVNDLGLKDRVHFIGFVRPEELGSYAKWATIGYNVSEPVSESYRLSLNNKFFDYVHAELPSIINDFPEYRHFVQEFAVGTLVKNEDVDIIKVLNNLWDNSHELNNLKRSCGEAKKVWN
jgi:glycosyltransferase involved in cell wall biosynthesis